MTELEEPFATVEDLQEWWPEMPTGSEPTAKKKLLAASQYIVNANGGEVPDVAAITLEIITASMVRRAMAIPDDAAGYSQMNISAGSYSASGTVQNPHGDLYLTKSEKQQLGIGGQRAFEVDLLAGSRRAGKDHRARLLDMYRGNAS